MPCNNLPNIYMLILDVVGLIFISLVMYLVIKRQKYEEVLF